MKRLFYATIALFAIAGATFWFLGKSPEIDPATLDKLKLVSRFSQVLPKAEAGDPQAQFEVARMYQDGDGTKKDLHAAAAWYQKAADRGHGGSQVQLGLMYANGQGVRQDYAAAAKWYRLASTFNNNADAQFRLGELYFNGRGVEHDFGKAIEFYTMAASKGHAAAQYLLGSMYAEGWGAPQDSIVAYIWLKMAAAKAPEALAVHPKYDAVKKLEAVKAKMNKFQIEEAERRLAELAKRR